MSGRAAEGGDAPDIGLTESLTEVDFRAVGGKTQDRLVALVFGELERITAGSEHDENLIVTFDGRSEGNGASIGRERWVDHGLVPLADFRDLGGAFRSAMIKRQIICAVTSSPNEKNKQHSKGKRIGFISGGGD